MQARQFLSPAEVAHELGISTSTVLRLIHAGDLPAIAISARIYRVPAASFELFKAGQVRQPELAPMGGKKPRPRLGRDEALPIPSRRPLARAR